MMAGSANSESPFVARSKPDRYEPNALDLAKVAAAVDPRLAKQKPAEAVRIARNLLSAAQEDIEESYRRHHDEVEYWSGKQRKRRREQLFPPGACIGVPDAFSRWRGNYKTLRGFADALRRKNLVITGSNDEELTSKQAVNELERMQKENEKARDRRRKAEANKKNLR